MERWKEKPDENYWVKVMRIINKSDFCLGRIPGKDWTADFEFFVRSSTHAKALEGKYTNRKTKEEARKVIAVTESGEKVWG